MCGSQYETLCSSEFGAEFKSKRLAGLQPTVWDEQHAPGPASFDRYWYKQTMYTHAILHAASYLNHQTSVSIDGVLSTCASPVHSDPTGFVVL